jgi:hypothetical protein
VGECVVGICVPAAEARVVDLSGSDSGRAARALRALACSTEENIIWAWECAIEERFEAFDLDFLSVGPRRAPCRASCTRLGKLEVPLCIQAAMKSPAYLSLIPRVNEAGSREGE